MFTQLMNAALTVFEQQTMPPGVIRRCAPWLWPLLACGSRARVLALQCRRLRATVRYTYRHSPFYRAMFDRLSLPPEAIQTPADLRRLPFTTDRDIANWQQFLCVPTDRLSAVYATSGTSGTPKTVYYSYRDLQMLCNMPAIAMRALFPRQLTVAVALPLRHGLWIGADIARRVVERSGGLALPLNMDDPRETLHWLQLFTPNALITAPSYLVLLTGEAQRQGYRPPLARIYLGGELLADDMRAFFADYWQADIVSIYGTTEIGAGQVMSLCAGEAYLLNDLQLVAEIVDPESGEPADDGELVCTTLLREAMPLLRYRSHDRARWVADTRGMALSSIHLEGRLDDLLLVGGLHLYAGVIADALAKLPGASGRLALIIDQVDRLDRLTLRVEGRGVAPAEVRQRLLARYPELDEPLANGGILLQIDPDANLGGQLKALQVDDRRHR